MSENILFYLLKRGDPASLDYAVPINTTLTAQRLQCSGKKIERVEVIFPIRISNPIPVLIIKDEFGEEMERIELTGLFTNPSRAIFYADIDIVLDGKVLNFMISRDCNIAFYIKD